MCEEVGSSSAFALATLCQQLVGEVLFDTVGLDLGALSERFASVPGARSYMDAAAAAAILLRFTRDLGTVLHNRLHAGEPRRRCGFSADSCALPCVIDPCQPAAWNPADAVAIWASRFTEEVGRAHDLLAERARLRLMRNPAERLSLPALARDAGASVSVVRRRLRATIGETPLQYRTRVRVIDVIRFIRLGWKMEAIAAQVGWKSRKDVYRALETVAGLSTAQIRALTDGETEALLARIGRSVGPVNPTESQNAVIAAR